MIVACGSSGPAERYKVSAGLLPNICKLVYIFRHRHVVYEESRLRNLRRWSRTTAFRVSLLAFWIN